MNNSNNTNLNIYIAIIFPGSLLLLYLAFLTYKIDPGILNVLIKFSDFSKILLLFFILVGTVICGQIVYAMSNLNIYFYYTEWKNLYFKIKKVDRRDDVFLEFSKIRQEEIVKELGRIYGKRIKKELNCNYQKYLSNKISRKEFGIKNYCYSLVDSKEAKHDTLKALADFLKGTSFIFNLVNFYFICVILKSSFVEHSGKKLIINLVIMLIVSFVANILEKRSRKMRKTADNLIYSQFLFNAKVKPDNLFFQIRSIENGR